MSDTAVQKFSIALATVDDCRECAGLLVGQLREHGVGASAKRLAQVLENVVADAGRGFLVLARDNTRIIGVAYVVTIPSAEHCGLVAWLEELYVLPEQRCRGAGTALLNAVLDVRMRLVWLRWIWRSTQTTVAQSHCIDDLVFGICSAHDG